MARILLLVALCLAAALNSSQAQSNPKTLASQVRDYFAAVKDKEAARILESILQSKPNPRELLALVKKRPAQFERSIEFSIEHQGSELLVRVVAPEGHDANSKPLPVVFDPASDGTRWHLLPDVSVIRVAIPKFTPGPSEFTDLGRDAYIRVLQMAAWLANGDPEQLWFTGFSWAAHASYDTALHRPRILRGILPMGGGPRRTHFRLMPNLAGTRVLSLCGAHDDKQLIWNLREVDRIKKKHRIDFQLVIDPDRGHSSDLKGRELTATTIEGAAPRASWPRKGRLLADMAFVENRWLRIDEVDERRVQAPRRIPVSRSLSYDGKRRATIKAMDKYVVRVDWTQKKNAAGALTMTLQARGVKSATLLLRNSMVTLGTPIFIKAGKTKIRMKVLKVDTKALLQQARRTGNRLDPAIIAIGLKF